MTTPRYSLGLDFGTESGRALLVDVVTGQEVASAVHVYGDGVIDTHLPGTSIRLGADWALQNPADYIEVLRRTVPEVLALANVYADQVIGIGVDFTACTVLPTRADGTPLCFLEEWKLNPHAWPKLWKHHAAQSQADKITALAAARGESWLARYGGRISSEWMHSKVLQVVEEAPEVYRDADRFIEASDWVVWFMTGVELRNSCAAGCKALWVKGMGYPNDDFLFALNPTMQNFNREKLAAPVVPVGSRAGALTEEAAELMGLHPGTAVAMATIDAHASVPGAGVTETGRMVLILGTSTCQMLVDGTRHLVPGISGVVEDSIIPGKFGYEAGQAGVGNIFEWFVHHGVPGGYEREAAARHLDVFSALENDAARLAPGQCGLLALDWWNGNRSVLVDASLSGLFVGLTLATRPPDIYRALIEATAFGTKIIIDTFESNGVTINELVAAGGLATRNKLLLQIYADVTGREFKEAGSELTSALGAAMFGAVAAGADAGGYNSITDAARSMASFKRTSYKPDPTNTAIYAELFAEYQRLHDYFGQGGNDVMKRLRGELGYRI